MLSRWWWWCGAAHPERSQGTSGAPALLGIAGLAPRNGGIGKRTWITFHWDVFPFIQALTSQKSLFSGRYEDEINKRTAAENEFVVLKKVSQDQLRVAKPWAWGPWEKWGVLAPWHSLLPQKRGNPRNLEGLSEVFSMCSPNPDSAKGWKWWGFLQI